MSMARMFLDQHAFLHSGDITNGRSFFDQVFADLTDAQMRVRAGKGANSLAWLLWHVARTEDVSFPAKGKPFVRRERKAAGFEEDG